ncbi:sensor histidine kinase [Maribacter sp. 2307UL18-2]|uniref:sensor histidine kinase n=1 Tax=Maribacter sp. 2307UL18-2 TaxID=3386274 RepID=UPI0039BD91B3
MKEKPYQFLDPKLFRVLLVYYLVAYIIDFIGTILIYNQNDESTVILGHLVLQYLILFVCKLTYIAVSLWLTRNSFKKGTFRLGIIPIHLALAALLSFYTAFIGILVDIELLSSPTTLTAESVYIRGLGGLSFNFFMYFSMIAIVYAYNYFQRKKTDDLRTSTLKAELLDAKIRALQAQLNPHFLFNSLNDISSLVDQNTIKAQNAIADLSQLLRKTLHLKDSKLVALKDELLLLDTYAKMEKLRYDDKWELIKSIPQELNGCLVPPLLFQPFLENTIKHGFSEQHQKIRAVLSIQENNEYLEITIINNGIALPSESPILGNGIGNILERLDSLFHGDFEFDIGNEHVNNEHFHGPVVRIQILLPLLKKNMN